MVNISFRLSVLYSTLAVFDPELDRPFNDWTDVHVAQGFSWRPGSVSFATLEDGGPHQVEVRQADGIELKTETKRAILVPFSVGPVGLVEIASIPDGRVIAITPGSYGLIYEVGYAGSTPWCRLTFISGGETEAAILRADEQLAPMYPLLMEAEPSG